MKVFISWSGELSKKIAELLKTWIPNVLQNAEPWISSEDIEKGEVWFGAISEKLADISVGIICLTKINLNAPWILFEAGSLSKGLAKNRICTLLIDLEPSDLKPPLAQFNATKALKADMAKLIKTINAVSNEKALAEARVEAAFEMWWPDFEKRFNESVKSLPPSLGPRRSVEDMTSEILTTVRAMHNQMQETPVLDLDSAMQRARDRIFSSRRLSSGDDLIVRLNPEDIQPKSKSTASFLSSPPTPSEGPDLA
jgi:hypothetical protein